MGNVRSKQQSDPYDDYQKMDKPKPAASVTKNTALNNRINKLTLSLKKGDQDLSQVKEFFNKELKDIKASHGDKNIKDSLFLLKNKINEKFDNPEGHELAFQIQCTAQALIQPFEMSQLPDDVQKIIFYQYGAEATDFNDLLFLQKNPENADAARNGWIDANHISLKKVGCKNAKEAIKYVIDHNLKSANLCEFMDLKTEDLKKLFDASPFLEELSIPPVINEGVGKLPFENLSNLKSLSIAHTLMNEKEFTEALGKLTNLQSLDAKNCDLPEKEFIEALKKLSNLRSLDVSFCYQLSETEFAAAVAELTSLQNLNLVCCDNDLIATIKSKFPHLNIMGLSPDLR